MPRRVLTPEIDLYAPMREVRRPLPLPVLIDVLAERASVAHGNERIPVGCLGELLDQAIAHLRRLHEMEAGRA